MKKLIVITEHYDSESACTSLYDYDSLPANLKSEIDRALQDPNKSIEVSDANSLQSLYDTNLPEIAQGEVTEFIGAVDFYTVW